MKYLAILIFFCTPLLFLSSQMAHAQNDEKEVTLCKPSEDIYFSCPMKNKIVSVCAKNNVSPDAGYVQYRYGTTEDIEMIYPKNNVPPRDIFSITDASEGSAAQENLKFKNGSYDYVLYHGFTNGLYVVKGDKAVFRGLCDSSSYGSISRAAHKGIQASPKTEIDLH